MRRAARCWLPRVWIAVWLFVAPIHAMAQVPPDVLRPLAASEKRLLIRQLNAIAGYATIGSRDPSLEAAVARIDKALKSAKSRVDLLERQQQGNLAELRLARAAVEAARIEQAETYERGSRVRAISGAEDQALQARVKSLVEDATPEKLAALQRFADGDRIGAWPILEVIHEIQVRAKTVAIADMEQDRAQLVDVMRANGEQTSVQALDAWTRVVTADPKRPWVWLRVGDLRRATGNVTGAEMAYRQAIVHADALGAKLVGLNNLISIEATRRDGGLYTEREIGLTKEYYEALGKPFDPAIMRGDREDQTAAERQMAFGQKAIAEPPAASDTANPAWEIVIRGHLALASAHITGTRKEKPKLDLARIDLDTAKTLLARYGDAIPVRNDAESLRALRESYEAALAEAHGDHRAELKHLDAALTLQRQVLRRDPANVYQRSRLGYFEGQRGDAEAALGRADRALSAYRAALSAYLPEIAEDPLSVYAAGAVREIVDRFVPVCQKSKAPLYCVPDIDQLLTSLRKIPRGASSDADGSLILAEGNAMLARAGLIGAAGRYEEAAQIYHAVDQLFAAQVHDGAPDPTFVSGRGVVAFYEGQLDQARGDTTTALIHHKQAIDYILASSTPSPKGPLLRGPVDLLILVNAAVEVAKLSGAPDDWAYAVLCFDAAVALKVLDPKTVDKVVLKPLAQARARSLAAASK